MKNAVKAVEAADTATGGWGSLIVQGVGLILGWLFGGRRPRKMPPPTYRCGELPTEWVVTRSEQRGDSMIAFAVDMRTWGWWLHQLQNYAAPWNAETYNAQLRQHREDTERLRPFVDGPRGEVRASEWLKLATANRIEPRLLDAIRRDPALGHTLRGWRTFIARHGNRWLPTGVAYRMAAIDMRPELTQFLAAGEPLNLAQIETPGTVQHLLSIRQGHTAGIGERPSRTGQQAVRVVQEACYPWLVLAWPAQYTIWEAGASGRLRYNRLRLRYGTAPEGSTQLGQGYVVGGEFSTLSPQNFAQIELELAT